MNYNAKEFQNDCWIYGLMSRRDAILHREIECFLTLRNPSEKSQEAGAVIAKMQSILEYYKECGGDEKTATISKIKERFWKINERGLLNPPSKWDQHFRTLYRGFRKTLDCLGDKIANRRVLQ